MTANFMETTGHYLPPDRNIQLLLTSCPFPPPKSKLDLIEPPDLTTSLQEIKGTEEQGK